MKNLVVVIIIISIPVLSFVNVWQGYCEWRLKEEISLLEDEQVKWFEENKLMIAKIAVANSPNRIDSLAKDQLNLKKADDDTVFNIQILDSKRGE